MPFRIAEPTGITDAKGYMRFGAKLLQHGIESIDRPIEQATEAVHIDRVLPTPQAGVRRMEASPERVRMGHPALFFLRLEPLREGLAHGMIARGFLAPVTLHPVQIPVEMLEERIGEAQADDAGAVVFFAWHGSLFAVMALSSTFSSIVLQ
jgi:hypothetical protein